MRYMDKEQFKRKWVGTHTELNVIDKLNGTSLIDNSVSKKQLKNIEKTKRNIEKKSIDQQLNDVSEMLYDAVGVRKNEVLDQDKLPIKDLLMLTIKAHPQHAKIENTGNVNFTFADMIEKSSFTLNKVKTIDVEEVNGD